jgi:hypothetical protein
VRSVCARLFALVVGLGVLSASCVPAEIRYEPAVAVGENDPLLARSRRPPVPASRVAVFDSTTAPWDYVVVGELRESERDGVPGDGPVRTALFREVAAEHGCDGIILNGNVSRFDGRTKYVLRKGRARDGSSRRGRWVAVIELEGAEADCVVRRGGGPEA